MSEKGGKVSTPEGCDTTPRIAPIERQTGNNGRKKSRKWKETIIHLEVHRDSEIQVQDA
jgi:hypothetical protein